MDTTQSGAAPSRIQSLLRPNIAAMQPYSTARDEYGGGLGIFLDANESPYPNGVNRYPDPRQKALKARIAAIKGIPERNLFLGNGSDEAIDLLFRVFCRPGVDDAVAICPSYGMYKVAAQTNDVALREVLLEPDFSLDTGKLLSACGPNTKLILLCSPNNPSGVAFPLEQIRSVADRFPGIVMVDEAYVDFSTKGSIVPDALRRDNIAVLQTLSKAWGMAGLRIGLCIASTEIVDWMGRVKYPYNIGVETMRRAFSILEEPIDAKVAEICAGRRWLEEQLSSMPGLVRQIHPSDANFLLVRFDDPDRVYDYLIGRGIIVRNRSRVPLCGGCLRLTVGLPEENEALVRALREYPGA